MNGTFVDCCVTVHLRMYSVHRSTNSELCLVCVDIEFFFDESERMFLQNVPY